MAKAKDFTASAVKLCNPEPVKELLEKLSIYSRSKEDLEAKIEERCVDLVDGVGKCNESIAEVQQQIREAVEEHGSYQDTEGGRYAVKYASKTAVYGNLASFRKNFPKFVELCIKEVLDVAALKGQVKGKLITEEQLEKAKVLTYDKGYSFYVR